MHNCATDLVGVRFESFLTREAIVFHFLMVNVKESSSKEARKSEDKGKSDDLTEEHPEKNYKGIHNTTHLQERLKTLESRIEVVRSDFKKQVEGLRMRMENVNTNLKTVQGNMGMDSPKTGIVHEIEASDT